MRINRSSADVQQAELAARVREPAAKPNTAAGTPAEPVAAPARVDRVEISDAGRAMAAQDQQGATDAGRELSPERAAELRERVLSGAYNSLEVVDQVARRMLQRGDV